MISALFVEEGGCYFNDSSIDPWGIKRNAMNYCGNNPVICHPPCQLWEKMAKVNYARWGGEHNKPGNDGGAFKFALEQVNRCGGVLEHPAMTYAWSQYGLQKPKRGAGWEKSGDGWVCEVWQSAYGHKANKATWLYYKGHRKPFDLDWSTPQGAHQIGGADKRGKEKNKPTISGKAASATPGAFKDALINLAIWSHEHAQIHN